MNRSNRRAARSYLVQAKARRAHLCLSCQPSLLCQFGRLFAFQHLLCVELRQRIKLGDWSTHLDTVQFKQRVIDHCEPLIRLADDGQLAIWKHAGFWRCMDTLRDLEQLEGIWNEGNAPWLHGESA